MSPIPESRNEPEDQAHPEPSWSSSGTSPAPGLAAAQIVIDAAGVTAEQAAAVVARIEQEQQPRSLVAYVKAIVDKGGLAKYLNGNSNGSSGAGGSVAAGGCNYERDPLTGVCKCGLPKNNRRHGGGQS